MPEWTSEQKRAIETRDCNLLVAAGAGAGKTAVLVERIIRKILDGNDPIDIDNLLVVTFTNAAASEMRERIGEAISREIEKNPDSGRLQRQITLLGKAEITTIHSFCLEVIRNNFHLLDLDPAFRIADSTETVLLKQEAIEEVFDEKYENGDEGFLNLVECYGGGRGDGALMDMVLKLFEFSRSTPDPDGWISQMAEKFNINGQFDFGASQWAKVITEDIRIELSGLISMMENAITMIDGLADFEPYCNHLKKELMSLKGLLKCCHESWDTLYDEFSKVSFDKIPACKKGADKETQKKVKDIRDSVKDEINTIKDDVLSCSSSDIAKQMKEIYPHMLSLSCLVKDFGQRFALKKKEKGVIDFSDIEHFCIDILTARDEKGNFIPSEAALAYRERFREILIDEYQDSNMVQELILTTISRRDSDRPNIFMVGDVKQSIYRFRQAKPELFLHKYNTYSMDDASKERKILLYKNFRSRKEVIEAVNYVFKSIMSANIGELDYNDGEKLNLGADYETLNDKDKTCGGPAEVHIIETKKGGNEDKDSEDDEISSTQLEARMVARKIEELKNNGFMVYDRNIKSYRPVEYRDIVILMRATASSAPIFMEELTNAGIPTFADTGSGYFEVPEVQVMLSLLQVVDNPMQDIPLLAVLRSPIVSMTPEELVDIRLADGKKTYYEALKIKSQGDDAAAKKAQQFLKNLERWREKSLNIPISEFIWYLYSDTGYYAFAGAMPGGVQRQANLRVLFERARQYEETSFKGLFNFINFINKLKGSSGDMGSAKVLGENENVVRIMSIHKSKGLEFPVVFVSGMGKKFNLMDLNNSILFHHELGFGPDYVDSKRRISYPTVIKQALRKKMRLENYSEEMRILYVAFTRAKEKLIITGTVPDLERSCKKWSGSLFAAGYKVPEYEILKGNTFFDWLCPSLMKHMGCGALREAAAAVDENLIDDTSAWDIRLWTREEVLNRDDSSPLDITDSLIASSEETGEDKYEDEITRRLGYEYPYKKSSYLPAKLSVTELKRLFGTALDDEYTRNIFVPPLIRRPSFLETSEKLSAAEKGTIMHLVMQHLSLDKAPLYDDVRNLVSSMVEEEFITEEKAKAVDIGRILAFFGSPLGERLIKSGNARREVPFYMDIRSTEVVKDLPAKYEDEKIILQGIIDCYFEKDDGLVLIDYKTDYIPNGDSAGVKEKYRLQIDYYSEALERLTGKKVKEKYIYLFFNGEILEY